jgi:hypothetical protein
MNLINSVTSGLNFNLGSNHSNIRMNNVIVNDDSDEDDDEEDEEDEENENDEENDLNLFLKKKNKYILELDEFQFKHLKKYSALKEDKCPICLQKYKSADIIKEFPCKHIFHKNCIFRWLKSSNICPICKHDLSEEINKIELIEEDND